MKKCPFCAEDIQDAAIVCRHCGRDLSYGETRHADVSSREVTRGPERARRPGAPLNRVALAVLLVCVVAAAVVVWLRVAAPSFRRDGVATYRITGTARSCAVSYQGAGRVVGETVVTIPWTVDVTGLRSGDFLQVSCRIDQAGDEGSIVVSIEKDGVPYLSGQAAAFPQRAGVSGTY
jgi:hypothetical protein